MYEFRCLDIRAHCLSDFKLFSVSIHESDKNVFLTFFFSHKE